MRLSNALMYSRLMASDASYNGRFFAGITTTGIFCLSGCHARKPRPENVRFFPTCEAARAAGLRPCRKCSPEDFARGADFVLETIEQLVTAIRAHPGEFRDVRTIVARSGFSSSRLFELFRIHYHSTPAAVLLSARLARAGRLLLETTQPLADVALESGFASASVFHERFREYNGLTPSGYRALSGAASFTLTPPPGYSFAHLNRALSRDPTGVDSRLIGKEFKAAVRIDGRPHVLRLKIEPPDIRVELDAPIGPAGHTLAARILGLGQDAAGFVRLSRSLGLSRLTAGRTGLRITQTTSAFDGLIWSIVGQQINFPFACTLKRRLFELAGEPVGGLIAVPTPEAVAGIDPEQLRPLQYSRQKADYLVSTARLIASGNLDLESLRGGSATRAERTLLAVRGLGPWSVNYLMMRSLGFADCVPLGDTGVTSGLKTLFRLDERPDADGTRRLMTAFSPFRSLATAHLWQL